MQYRFTVLPDCHFATPGDIQRQENHPTDLSNAFAYPVKVIKTFPKL